MVKKMDSWMSGTLRDYERSTNMRSVAVFSWGAILILIHDITGVGYCWVNAKIFIPFYDEYKHVLTPYHLPHISIYNYASWMMPPKKSNLPNNRKRKRQ